MEPCAVLPARSRISGIKVNALGGKPLVAGGSPAASPIWRWAWQRRVRESISSSTLSPWSRKYSLIVQATLAARTRSSGASSPVLTITTQRARPSGPRLLCRNSCTSRPRSPIRAMMLTSALVCLAICDISVLLPTPGPEKMPMRCPSPQVSRPSTARTLVAIGWRMFCRSRGPTPPPPIPRATPVDPPRLRHPQRPLPVHRLAEPVEHAAQQLVRAPHARRRAEALDHVPARPARRPRQRHEQRPVLAEADDLGPTVAPAEAVDAAQAPERQRQ